MASTACERVAKVRLKRATERKQRWVNYLAVKLVYKYILDYKLVYKHILENEIRTMIETN